MDSSRFDLSRRQALGVLSGALTAGISGCTGGETRTRHRRRRPRQRLPHRPRRWTNPTSNAGPFSGVVSARRTLKSDVETIQTDAAINSDNSGGPVYDSDGEVVGVATFGPADAGIEDTGFALPIETATEFLDELGVEPEQSDLSTTYQEGLNALWRDDCETVEAKMNDVLDMWSNHPYAEDIIDKC